MKVRDILRAPKRITALGEWKSGKMPRSAFPLSKSKNKAYSLGNRRWRVVEFSALECDLRLLINYSAKLGQYQAILGLLHRSDTRVLVQFEHHPDHKGWHAHSACDDVAGIPPGIKRGPWNRDLAGRACGAPRPAMLTDDDAFRLARMMFRLHRVAPLELGT